MRVYQFKIELYPNSVVLSYECANTFQHSVVAMRKMFRKIISLFLLVAFLMPSVVKMEHKHIHHFCNAKNEKHLHVKQEICSICSFEFSVFSSDKFDISLQNDKPLDSFCDNYRSNFYYTHPKFSFQLRAPPCQLI